MADNVVLSASERSRLVKALFDSIEQSSSLLNSDELRIYRSRLKFDPLEPSEF